MRRYFRAPLVADSRVPLTSAKPEPHLNANRQYKQAGRKFTGGNVSMFVCLLTHTPYGLTTLKYVKRIRHHPTLSDTTLFHECLMAIKNCLKSVSTSFKVLWNHVCPNAFNSSNPTIILNSVEWKCRICLARARAKDTKEYQDSSLFQCNISNEVILASEVFR